MSSGIRKAAAFPQIRLQQYLQEFSKEEEYEAGMSGQGLQEQSSGVEQLIKKAESGIADLDKFHDRWLELV